MADIISGAHASHELCQLLCDYDPAAHPKRAILSEKFDGIRCLWIGGRMVSREGSPMECAEHARPELDALERAFGEPMVFDAELVVDDSLSATLSAFRSRRRTGVLRLFDAVPLECWLANTPHGCPQLEDRLLIVQVRLGALRLGTVLPVTWESCNGDNADRTYTKVRNAYVDALRDGGEGIVIKDATAPYYRGRSKAWMKLTPEVERKRKLKEIA